MICWNFGENWPHFNGTAVWCAWSEDVIGGQNWSPRMVFMLTCSICLLNQYSIKCVNNLEMGLENMRKWSWVSNQQNYISTQIAKLMGPTWGPPWEPHVGPINLAIRVVKYWEVNNLWKPFRKVYIIWIIASWFPVAMISQLQAKMYCYMQLGMVFIYIVKSLI